MKSLKVALLGLFLSAMFVGVALAEKKAGSEKVKPEAVKKAEKQDVPEVLKIDARKGMRSAEDKERQPMDPEERFKKSIENRRKAHQEEVDKLVAIKKIADEENATKTAAALQTLIDEMNAKFEKQIKDAEQQRIEMQKRSKERLEQRKKMYEERMKANEGKEQPREEKAPKKAGKEE